MKRMIQVWRAEIKYHKQDRITKQISAAYNGRRQQELQSWDKERTQVARHLSEMEGCMADLDGLGFGDQDEDLLNELQTKISKVEFFQNTALQFQHQVQELTQENAELREQFKAAQERERWLLSQISVMATKAHTMKEHMSLFNINNNNNNNNNNNHNNNHNNNGVSYEFQSFGLVTTESVAINDWQEHHQSSSLQGMSGADPAVLLARALVAEEGASPSPSADSTALSDE